MKAKGWEVTRTHYDVDSEVYAWRHDLPGGKSSTLRIARYVLEHYPAIAILEHLDRLRVAAAIRARPAARLVVVQNGQRVTLEEATGEERVLQLLSGTRAMGRPRHCLAGHVTSGFGRMFFRKNLRASMPVSRLH
jgi:hypothetical protein